MKRLLFAVFLLLSSCSAFYSQSSPLPSATNMKADCVKTPGSVSCDLYSLLTSICNGSVALPLQFGLFEQTVCVAQGYRTIPAAHLSVQ